MKWTQIDKYHMRSGEWIICKCSVGGMARYQLWDGQRMVDVYDSAEEAKQIAATTKGK